MTFVRHLRAVLFFQILQQILQYYRKKIKAVEINEIYHDSFKKIRNVDDFNAIDITAYQSILKKIFLSRVYKF